VSKRKRSPIGHEEEHENHERWLLTYADMITLLMVLFIVLYAISQVDLAKFGKLRTGLSDSFGDKTPAVFDGGSGGQGALEGGQAPISPLPSASKEELLVAGEKALKEQYAAAQEQQHLQETKDKLSESLSKAGLDTKVRFRVEQRGLVVTIATDQVLFKVGQAALEPGGRGVLDQLATALRTLPNLIAIEGHTDDTPILGSALFDTNWELSTARATTVLRYLIERHGLPAERLSASGYADQRPVADNLTDAGRAANRRVEIVVVAATPTPAAAETSTEGTSHG
jgi:chemotaxis protein MotB